jgi:hypothetical protein
MLKLIDDNTRCSGEGTKMRTVMVFLVMAVCAGCTQTVYLYEDHKLSPSETATLSIANMSSRYEKHMSLEVDGEPVTWDKKGSLPIIVRMLPGSYNIKWIIPHGSVTFPYVGMGILEAKKGESYEFGISCLRGKCKPTGFNQTANGSEIPYECEVKAVATWMEKTSSFMKPIAVVGTRPEWVDAHNCEICKKKKADGGKYGCYDCRGGRL